jgi:glycosyltransferase involved in cell wall biosynthesis
MPVYNGQKTLAQAIESVLRQEYEDWELLIVNDASTDETLPIAVQYAAMDKRVRVLSLKDNSGVGSARNRALEAARGQYVAFLDADDAWDAKKLKVQVDFIREADCGIVYSSYRLMDDSGHVLGKIVEAPEQVTYKSLLRSNSIGCLTALVDVTKTGFFRMPDLGHEDYACWLGLLSKGAKACGMPEPLASYRLSRSSVSGNKLKSFTWVWKIYRKHLSMGFGEALFRNIAYFFSAVLKYSKVWSDYRK